MAHTARPRPASTRPVSDLIQHTEEVLRDAEQQPVALLREDRESLVLMSQHELEAQDALLSLAGEIVTAALDAPSLEVGLAQAYPWMSALSPEDRELCTAELVAAARAALSRGRPDLALGALNSWRDSAEAIAARLGADPVEWLEEPIVVERPRERKQT
ncbi:hypothetical protein [Brachybacterium sp. sponge]|uniref:hypothetical protein n=1 Tax=Brachybacterium sp. sponge TaxID=1775432 RepID=UPI0007A4748F|nr:hypothetical protein [Brachybacterium sp. sponge]